jgi:hypothetical protein
MSDGAEDVESGQGPKAAAPDPASAADTGPAALGSVRARRKLRWERAFLKELSRTGNVTAACAAARIGRASAYEHADRHKDFEEAWRDALEASADLLELEAHRRAHDGVDEPVIYQGELCGFWADADGNVVAKGAAGARLIPLTVKKYSDRLLEFLLKARRPEKYRERIDVEHAGRNGRPIDTQVTFFIPDNGRETRDRSPTGASDEVPGEPG